MLYSFSTLLNPKITLELKNFPVVQGKEFTVSWQIGRQAAKYRQLKVKLVRKLSRGGLGGRRWKECYKTLNEQAVSRSEPLALEKGKLRFCIPINEQPTFWAAINNWRCIWVTRVEGITVSWQANVIDEYELTVYDWQR